MKYSNVNLSGIEKMRFRMASSSIGGTLELRAGSKTGQLIGSVAITNTGGGQRYQWFETPVTDPGGPFTLHLVFTADGTHYIANVNFFEFVGDGIALESVPPTVTASLDPAGPNGSDGFYTSPVTVILAGTDNAPGAVNVEYRLDGGTWTSYAGAVTVGTDGSHGVDYRATDAAGNVSTIGSISFRIDATAPTIAVTGLADGDSRGDSGEATVSWSSTDATSGVESTSATLDGSAIAADTVLRLTDLALGEHTLVVTAADKAGNTATRSITFEVTTSLADLDALLTRYNTDGTVSDKTTANLRYSLSRAIAAAADGSEQRTMLYLEQFAARADNQVKGDADDDAVRELLLRDARVLIEHYQALEDAENAAVA
jgi:hypothetical protein